MIWTLFLIILVLFTSHSSKPLGASDSYPKSITPVAFSWTENAQWPDRSGIVYGLRFSALSSEHKHMIGLDIGPFSENEIDQNFIGAQFGVTNDINRGYGLQVSLWNSRIEREFIGIQIGLGNNAGTHFESDFYLRRIIFQLGAKNSSAPMLGLQVGLLNQAMELNGAQVGILNIGELGSFRCGQIGLFNFCGRGVQVGFLNSLSVWGIQVGGINGIYQEGLQFGLYNFSEEPPDPKKLDLLVNPRIGLQVAFVNRNYDNYSGVQIGAYNSADNFSGLQFGLVNVANRLNGLQIGVINAITNPRRSFPATAPVRVFPVVNWSFG